MTSSRSLTRRTKIGFEIQCMLRRRKAILEEMQRIDRRIIALSRNIPIRISLDDCTIIDYDNAVLST